MRIARFWQTMRAYPIPVIALIGLIVGGIFFLASRQLGVANWVWYFTLLIGGIPLALGTLGGMLRGHFASDIIAMLAIIAAILLDQAFAGVIVVLMQSGGEAIEKYGLRRATSTLDDLLARAPRQARRKSSDNVLEDIRVEEVKVGDTLIVRQGDLIPVDGTIINGSAQVDESALTGEPLPKSKTVGDQVMSGTISESGGFEMHADRVSEESQYSRIVALVRQAQDEKPPIQRLADRYAVWFTPIALAISGIAFLITLNPISVLSVLVVATPCPLILATPIAVISSVNRAAQDSIIVKGGAAIEQIGYAQVVAFDKTGTITYGTPTLDKVVSLDKHISADELLLKAASVEQFSSHIIAKSLVQEAQKRFHRLEPITDYVETPGLGAQASILNQNIAVGSKKFIDSILDKKNYQEELGVDVNGQRLLLLQGQNYEAGKGQMTAYVSINGTITGILTFSDQIRLGVPEMMHRLATLGVTETVLLTGDNTENALSIARQAGINNVEANLLPEEKVAIIRKLSERFKTTVMVGDGINDAPALAAATVGVAMGAHGTGISAEAADIVLLVDDVTKVADAIQIGQRMLKIAKQGIYVGLGLSFVFMAIASFGLIPPAIGAMLQEAIDASVVLNALRAR
ncbi:MAG: heavy metal translocating P-type ATPase [Thaumarchaeota archaeon]|nr:heavy metal translocating P-type ATPase [Nitrososphaerota archaeon]